MVLRYTITLDSPSAGPGCLITTSNKRQSGWHVFRAGWGALSALAFAAAGPAQAQSREDTESVVIVQAERRTGLLQEVPVAMSALSSEQLEAVGIENADD